MKKHLLFALTALIGQATQIHAATFNPRNVSEFQDALDAASVNGEDNTLDLNEGNYGVTETLSYSSAADQSLVIRGKGIGKTILDGAGLVRALTIASDFESNSGKNISLKDMTIRDGHDDEGEGGGLALTTGGLAIRLERVEFVGNQAERGGGAILRSQIGAVSVDECLFQGNQSNISGGGLFIETQEGLSLRNSEFGDNTALSGSGGGANVSGANKLVLVEGNSFLRNRTLGESNGGGAAINTAQGPIVIRGNLLRENSSQGNSGGMNVNSAGSEVRVESNILEGNVAIKRGGGMFLNNSEVSTFLANNLVIANHSVSEGGGGIHLQVSSGDVLVLHNTLSENSAALQGGGLSFLRSLPLSGRFEAFNNIAFANRSIDGDDMFLDENAVSVKLSRNLVGEVCIIELDCNPSPLDPDENLLVQDPLFVDPEGLDFHLKADSPAVNAGDPEAPQLPAMDLDGNPRIGEGAPDLGAFEHALAEAPSPEPSDSPADEPGIGSGDEGGCSFQGPTAGAPRLPLDWIGVSLTLGLIALLARKLTTRRR